MDNYQQTEKQTTEQFQFGTAHHNLSDIMPSSSEIGHLWTAYQAESMAICFLKKWVHDATDQDLKPLLQDTLNLSTQRVEAMENLFNTVNYPIPQGFGEKDVEVNSPKLFSDSFTCLYTRMAQKLILTHYTSAATASYRPDFRNFYSDCVRNSDDLHRRITDMLLVKGILAKAPTVVTPNSLETVTDKDYFGSYFRVFGENRPLNAMEIGHIYTLIETKQLIRALNLGLSQVVKSEKIRNYISKCRKVADKHIETLASLLEDYNIPVPAISEISVSDTREPGMSDRLILTHTAGTVAYIITGYGLAIPNIFRKDIGVTLAKFMSEVVGLAKDGAEIMVNAGWLEKSPETADREKLVH